MPAVPGRFQRAGHDPCPGVRAGRSLVENEPLAAHRPPLRKPCLAPPLLLFFALSAGCRSAALPAIPPAGDEATVFVPGGLAPSTRTDPSRASPCSALARTSTFPSWSSPRGRSQASSPSRTTGGATWRRTARACRRRRCRGSAGRGPWPRAEVKETLLFRPRVALARRQHLHLHDRSCRGIPLPAPCFVNGSTARSGRMPVVATKLTPRGLGGVPSRQWRVFLAPPFQRAELKREGD